MNARVLLAASAALLLIAPTATAQDALPDGPGKAELTTTCTQCHDLGLVAAQHRTPDEWNDTLAKMQGFGASFSDAERAAILTYLNTNLGKGDAPAAAEPAPAAPAAPTPPSPSGR